MKRRDCIVIVLALASCRQPATTPGDILPPEVAGGWRRSELRSNIDTPSPIASLGVQSSSEATYSGTGVIRVRMYQMKSETSAFELRQKWRQADGIAAQKGPYFFVAKADGVDRDSVLAFLRELQRIRETA